MKSFAVTDIGQKRTVNQDYVFCSEEPVGKLSNLFVVADGMGGHNAGDTASRLCVGSVRESISNSELATPVSILNEAVAFAHDRVRSEAAAKPEFEGMGTTLVIATIQDNKLYVANVGDSRLYLLRDSLEQITEDHSLVEEMVKSGELSKENVK
ncbi:MAG: protein phosphatase 2C domain-containing protein, partial [Lachnospiraceae bacterium]|nr:protein phosphatase 2C domain-containing protein [Lachnospiraceae bacterium]